jgi:hypothetical protein
MGDHPRIPVGGDKTNFDVKSDVTTLQTFSLEEQLKIKFSTF